MPKENTSITYEIVFNSNKKGYPYLLATASIGIVALYDYISEIWNDITSKSVNYIWCINKKKIDPIKKICSSFCFHFVQ